MVRTHFRSHQLNAPFDQILADDWALKKAMRMPRSNFIKKYRSALEALCPSPHLTELLEAVEKGSEIPDAALHAVSMSRLGAALFTEETTELHYKQFVTRCEKMLDDVMHEDWKIGEVDNFRAAMKQEIRQVEASGFAVFGKKISTMPFLGMTIHEEVFSLEEEFNRRLLNRAKSAAISTGQLERMPWEKACFGDGPIPGRSQTGVVPDQLLDDAKNCRRMVLDALFPSPVDMCCSSLAELKKEVDRNIDMLLSLERGFSVDAMFLAQAEDFCSAAVHDAILQVLPSDGKGALLSTCIDAVEKLLQDPKVLRSDAGVKNDVDTVLKILCNLRAGIGPSLETLKGASGFFKQVYGKLEFFLHHDVGRAGAIWRLPKDSCKP